MSAYLEFDVQLFFFINETLRNDLFDAVMPWMRNKWTWIPLYLLLLWYVIRLFGTQAWVFVLFFLLTILLTDQAASSLIKPWVGRPRPCQDEALKQAVRLLVPCGSGYSFVSAHAANHFGMAVFFCIVLHALGRWWMGFAIGWASLIGLAQVYVGVHYPSDIVGGALLGTAIGTATAWGYGQVTQNKLWKRFFG